MRDIRDFYITYIGHPRYKEGEIIVEDIVRLVINKIEMVLFTNKGEFIGDINFGCDLPRYLWQTNVSVDFIRGIIQEQYDTYIPELRDFNTVLDVQIVEGQLQDIMVINTTINEFKVNTIFS